MSESSDGRLDAGTVHLVSELLGPVRSVASQCNGLCVVGSARTSTRVVGGTKLGDEGGYTVRFLAGYSVFSTQQEFTAVTSLLDDDRLVRHYRARDGRICTHVDEGDLSGGFRRFLGEAPESVQLLAWFQLFGHPGDGGRHRELGAFPAYDVAVDGGPGAVPTLSAFGPGDLIAWRPTNDECVRRDEAQGGSSVRFDIEVMQALSARKAWFPAVQELLSTGWGRTLSASLYAQLLLASDDTVYAPPRTLTEAQLDTLHKLTLDWSGTFDELFGAAAAL